jgi:hypothetical protein
MTGRVAAVTLRNDSDHEVEFHVDWRYNGSPIWLPGSSQCVKPGDVWYTTETYEYPDRGPNIELRAYHNCNVISVYWIGVSFGLKFGDRPSIKLDGAYRNRHDFCVNGYCART